jgi:hypothetical protein
VDDAERTQGFRHDRGVAASSIGCIRSDIGRGEAPAFVAICPNSKIPALVDHGAGVSIFESGAILIHLAEKTGNFPSPTSRTYPWIATGFKLLKAVKPTATGDGANVACWLDAIGGRPAVVKGMAVPAL